MEWYHAHPDGRREGPITRDELLALVPSGAVRPETLVWRPGLPDWVRLSESELGTTGTLPSGAEGGARAIGSGMCDECGRTCPETDLMPVGGVAVCPACKDRAVAKLRGGIPIGQGRWHDRKQLVLQDGQSLADLCIRCGNEAVCRPIKRTYHWHSPVLYILLLLSPIIYIIAALIVQRRMVLQLGLCPRCRKKRRLKLACGWLAFFASMGMTVAGGARDSGAMMLIGGLVWVGSLFWLVLAARLLVPARIQPPYGWFNGAPASVLERFPEWRP